MLTEFKQNRIKVEAPVAALASSLRQINFERKLRSRANCCRVKPASEEVLLDVIKSVMPYRPMNVIRWR